MGCAPTRQSSMDVLRLVAMVAVFVYHLDASSPVPSFTRRLGDVGITLFVMLSGYGLARSQGDRPVSFGAFMARKAWRILPSYWLSLALIALGLAAFTHKRPTGLWAAHASGLHALWPASPWGATVAANLWFLSLIMALYALFPWLHRRLSRAPLSRGLHGLLASHWLLWQAAQHLPGASRLLHYPGIQYVSPFFAFNVLPFGLGVLLARVAAGRSRWPVLAAATAVAAYYALLGLHDVALGVATFGAVTLTPPLPAPLARGVARITAASYEFYLLHHVLMGPLYRRWVMHTHAAPRWLFALAYATAVLALAEGVQRAAAWCADAVARRAMYGTKTPPAPARTLPR